MLGYLQQVFDPQNALKDKRTSLRIQNMPKDYDLKQLDSEIAAENFMCASLCHTCTE